MITWGDLRREPFRFFFPLGVCCGLWGVDHWLVYALGWSTAYSGFYHASIQVGAFMSCFVVGFLLTALPRFASAAPATSAEFALLAGCLIAQPFLLSMGWWMAAELCFIALLVAVAVFAARRFATRRSEVGPPTEFIWIPIGILHGVVGTLLMMLAQGGWLAPWGLAVGRPMAQQGFLLSVVLGVGGFMAPRLMGRGGLTVSGLDAAQARRVRRRRIGLHVLAGALVWASYWLEGSGRGSAAYLLRATIVTAELCWTSRLYRPPSTNELYVRFVWVSLWMIVVGLWGAGAYIRFRVAMLHIVFLGGFNLMVFGVATMVVLSHGGEGHRLREPLWVFPVVAVGLAIAMVVRLAAEVAPEHFFPLLGVAAGSWSIAGVSWLLFAFPHLLRRMPADTFERAHAAAKRQL